MRALKYVIYLALLGGALLMGWPSWQVLAVILTSEASYFREVPFWPLWAVLGAGVLGYAIYFSVGAAIRLRISIKHHLAVLGLFAAVLVTRIVTLLSPTTGTAWLAPEDAPPHWCLAQAAGRLQLELEKRFGQSDPVRFPRQAADLEALLRVDDRLPPSGFLHHGLKAPVRLVVVPGASGPVRTVRPGDRAGTLYYALSTRADDYWITAVGLTKYPTGEPAIMAGPDHAALVLGTTKRQER